MPSDQRLSAPALLLAMSTKSSWAKSSPQAVAKTPARQAAIQAGIPDTAPAWGMNQLCGSGLRAVALGAQQIADGSASVVVAGGQESMSGAPHCQHLRNGVKMGDYQMIDTMIRDGLWDAF